MKKKSKKSVRMYVHRITHWFIILYTQLQEENDDFIVAVGQTLPRNTSKSNKVRNITSRCILALMIFVELQWNQ